MTPEPPPRGTTGTPASEASRSVVATSSSLVARTTTSGSDARPSDCANSADHDQSRAQRSSSAASVDAVPTDAVSRSMKEAGAVVRDTGAFPGRIGTTEVEHA